MQRIKEVSKEAYEIGINEGWGEYESTHGYGIFDGEYESGFGPIYAKHIEKIDVMGVWESDEEAAIHFEKNEKIKIIRDFPSVPYVFIDTEETRQKIHKASMAFPF